MQEVTLKLLIQTPYKVESKARTDLETSFVFVMYYSLLQLHYLGDVLLYGISTEKILSFTLSCGIAVVGFQLVMALIFENGSPQSSGKQT